MHHPFLKKTLMTFVSLIMVFSFLGYRNATPAQALASTFYASVNGKSSNDGSQGRPWDLQTALNQPSSVKPGSTILIRGGTYKGMYTLKLRGQAGSPIRLMAHPTERVTLSNGDGPALDIASASYVDIYELEIAGPNNKRSTGRSESTYGVRVNQGKSSDHINFINMVFHDNKAQGIGWWQALKNSMIYGSLFYYNGTTELDHGIYAHSTGGGTKRFINNMVFDNSSHGFHGYAENNEKGLNNFTLDGNTFFNNGSIGYNTRKGKYGLFTRNILVGGLIRANNPVITNNYTYHFGKDGTSLNLGYKGGSSGARIFNNYFMGGQFAFGETNSGVQMSGNQIYAPGGVNGVSQSKFSANTWHSNKPRGVVVFVRSNNYDNRRANVTIYNWNRNNNVYLQPSQLAGVQLKAGQKYELRNVQNYYGDVVTGTYDGRNLVVPMTNHSVAQPYGLDFKPKSTFPEFGAFILIAK